MKAVRRGRALLHYDVLQGLWVLSRIGRLADPWAEEALNSLLKRQQADGMWRADGYF